MLIRVRSEFGTHRATDLDEDTARAVDVENRLRQSHATVYHPNVSVKFYLDPTCTSPVDVFQTSQEQTISHGTMLFAQLSPQWQCASCTFLNQRPKTGDSVCEVCQTKCDLSGTGTNKRPREEQQNEQEEESQSRETIIRRENKKPALARRVVIGGFLTWRGNDQSAESLDDFLQATRPTQVSLSDCAWIAIDNMVAQSSGYRGSSGAVSDSVAEGYTPYQQSLAKIQDMIDRGEKLKSSDKQACVDEILGIAISRGETFGKWMLFMNRDKVDDAWEKIARATADGRLGCSAKVAPSKELEDHRRALICIYVNDFSNKKEVKRVLQAIVELGFFVASGFKPDIFTHLGIETGNQWRLDPTIYKPKDVLDNWDV